MDYIKNPITGQMIKTHSPQGKQLLKNYINVFNFNKQLQRQRGGQSDFQPFDDNADLIIEPPFGSKYKDRDSEIPKTDYTMEPLINKKNVSKLIKNLCKQSDLSVNPSITIPKNTESKLQRPVDLFNHKTLYQQPTTTTRATGMTGARATNVTTAPATVTTAAATNTTKASAPVTTVKSSS